MLRIHVPLDNLGKSPNLAAILRHAQTTPDRPPYLATDVLRKVPQVSVDAAGNVELLGNPSILFLINGKKSTLFGNSIVDALNFIPASQIQSIEVMSAFV